jgi:hypothetical protein
MRNRRTLRRSQSSLKVLAQSAAAGIDRISISNCGRSEQGGIRQRNVELRLLLMNERRKVYIHELSGCRSLDSASENILVVFADTYSDINSLI